MVQNLRNQKAGVLLYRSAQFGLTEVLLISARKFPGSWVFPGGTRETGESEKQAAQRECEEESGYQVQMEGFVGKVNVNSVDYSFFLARPLAQVEGYESDRQLKWVPLAELAETVPPPFRPIAAAGIQLITGE